MNILAIDGGASSAKWQLRNTNGDLLGQGCLGPLHGHIYRPAEKQYARSILIKISDSLPAGIALDQIVAGIAGLATGSGATRWFRSEIREVFGLPLKSTFVSDDLGMVFLGNYKLGKNMVLYGGTGAIAFHVSSDMRILRAGGYGHLISDAGGGFWIGKQALHAMLLAVEEGIGSRDSPLFQRMAEKIGASEWNDIKSWAYEGGRQHIADLTQEVRVASGAGDPVAKKILSDAGYELACLANRLARRIDQPVNRIAFIGGISKIGGTINDTLLGQLDNDIEIEPSPIEGAEAMCKAATTYGAMELQKLLTQ